MSMLEFLSFFMFCRYHFCWFTLFKVFSKVGPRKRSFLPLWYFTVGSTACSTGLAYHLNPGKEVEASSPQTTPIRIWTALSHLPLPLPVSSDGPSLWWWSSGFGVSITRSPTYSTGLRSAKGNMLLHKLVRKSPGLHAVRKCAHVTIFF